MDLPQVGPLANDLLKTQSECHEDHKIATQELCKHKSHLVAFTLVVKNFGDEFRGI